MISSDRRLEIGSLAILNKIAAGRSKNNSPWMKLIGIALWHAPEETVEVLKQIYANDLKIDHQLKLLIDAHSGPPDINQ